MAGELFATNADFRAVPENYAETVIQPITNAIVLALVLFDTLRACCRRPSVRWRTQAGMRIAFVENDKNSSNCGRSSLPRLTLRASTGFSRCAPMKGNGAFDP